MSSFFFFVSTEMTGMPALDAVLRLRVDALELRVAVRVCPPSTDLFGA
jgi:hypothetical protein